MRFRFFIIHQASLKDIFCRFVSETGGPLWYDLLFRRPLRPPKLKSFEGEGKGRGNFSKSFLSPSPRFFVTPTPRRRGRR